MNDENFSEMNDDDLESKHEDLVNHKPEVE